MSGEVTLEVVKGRLNRKKIVFKNYTTCIIGRANASGGRDNITALVIQNEGYSAGSYERPGSLWEKLNE